jgi:hypothetical protein
MSQLIQLCFPRTASGVCRPRSFGIHLQLCPCIPTGQSGLGEFEFDTPMSLVTMCVAPVVHLVQRVRFSLVQGQSQVEIPDRKEQAASVHQQLHMP